jgi:hypothetical protein
MSTTLRYFAALAAALAIATPAQAQQNATHSSAIGGPYQPVSVFAGAALAHAAPMAPSTLDAALNAPVVFAPQERASSDVALMIVGAAGLVVGSLVDGDAGTIIMIGGGALALVGLYRYLT